MRRGTSEDEVHRFGRAIGSAHHEGLALIELVDHESFERYRSTDDVGDGHALTNCQFAHYLRSVLAQVDRQLALLGIVAAGDIGLDGHVCYLLQRGTGCEELAQGQVRSSAKPAY